MGIARYHALRRPASPRQLLLDVDIFNRPMRWADWLACMFFRRDEWFLVHVVGEDTLTGRTIEWTGRAVLIDGRSYLPEVPTLLSAEKIQRLILPCEQPAYPQACPHRE